MTGQLEITHRESWKDTFFKRMTCYDVEAGSKLLGYIVEESIWGVVTDRYTSEGLSLTKAQMMDMLLAYRGDTKPKLNVADSLTLLIVAALVSLGVYAYPVMGIPLLICLITMLEIERRRRQKAKEKNQT